MKKILLTCLMAVCCLSVLAQKADYRTTEDGLTKLLNNPEFIREVVNDPNLSLKSLDGYLTKYVPEYANYKLNTKGVNFNNLYYANTNTISNEELATKLGSLFNLTPAQSLQIKSFLEGNYKYSTPTLRDVSTEIKNNLYQRGKDAKVDQGVDNAVDFFQGKFGDNGVNSALIDIGGGLLGNLALGMNKRYEERMAAQALIDKAMLDKAIYTGQTSIFLQVKSYQQDLASHYKANDIVDKKTATEMAKMDVAIGLYSEAINKYKENPERAYYLYKAYAGRAKCKMEKGAYRAAIIDYYFAGNILSAIQKGNLPDKSLKLNAPDGYFDVNNKKTYFKGKTTFTFGTLTAKDNIVLLIGRAYAKYRLADYTGSLADCELTKPYFTNAEVTDGNNPNSYKDFVVAIKAMDEFGRNEYQSSYTDFVNSKLDNELINNNNVYGVTDFANMNKEGWPDALEAGTYMQSLGIKPVKFYGLPAYFPFDIAQIRGLSYYKAKHIDEAIAIYENIYRVETEKIITTNVDKKLFTNTGGDISSVFSSMGSFYLAKGNKDKALKLFNEAIGVKPDQLEYYLNRANCKKLMGDKAGADADLAVVKNPKILLTRKKAESYYATKLIQLNAANSSTEVINMAREAAIIYPQNPTFFVDLIKALNKENSADKTMAISKAFATNNARVHIILALYYRQSNDILKEEGEMFAAFENGLGFYETDKTYMMDISQKPYYCKLLIKYANKTNNVFIPKDFNKEKMLATYDSVYRALLPSLGNDKSTKKIYETARKKEYAKGLGNIEEYLAILEGEKKLTDLIPLYALDKIGCLFALQRSTEAIAYAKKIVKSGKIKESFLGDANAAINNNWVKSIKNIADSQCN